MQVKYIDGSLPHFTNKLANKLANEGEAWFPVAVSIDNNTAMVGPAMPMEVKAAIFHHMDEYMKKRGILERKRIAKSFAYIINVRLKSGKQEAET